MCFHFLLLTPFILPNTYVPHIVARKECVIERFWSSVHGLVPLHQHCTTSHRNRVDYIHELQEDCGKVLLEANVSGETLPFTSPALVISLAAELTALFQLLELGHAEAKQLICPVIEK